MRRFVPDFPRLSVFMCIGTDSVPGLRKAPRLCSVMAARAPRLAACHDRRVKTSSRTADQAGARRNWAIIRDPASSQKYRDAMISGAGRRSVTRIRRDAPFCPAAFLSTFARACPRRTGRHGGALRAR